MCLSVGQDPPKKHCYHDLTERTREGKQRAPQVQRGPACAPWPWLQGRWERISGPGPAGASRAPLWQCSMRSARRFHTLWVMPLSFHPPGEGSRRGVIMPVSQARKLRPGGEGTGRDLPKLRLWLSRDRDPHPQPQYRWIWSLTIPERPPHHQSTLLLSPPFLSSLRLRLLSPSYLLF